MSERRHSFGIIMVAAIGVVLLATSTAKAQDTRYPWQEQQQHSFDIGEGGSLRVRVNDADLAILTSDTGGASVVMRLRSNDMDWATEQFERDNYRARLDGNTIVVESDERRSNRWRAGNWMSVLVEVRIPSRFDLDVETQDGDVSVATFEGRSLIRSQDGDLTIDSLQGGDIDLGTQDGDVRASLLSGPTVRVNSQDGDIDVTSLRGAVTMHTQDGDIKIGSAAASALELGSTDGDIHVSIADGARMELETEDGDISIEAPSSLTADIDLAGEDVFIQGSFNLDGRVSGGRAEGRVNGGGERIRARTGDGGIRLVESGRR